MSISRSGCSTSQKAWGWAGRVDWRSEGSVKIFGPAPPMPIGIVASGRGGASGAACDRLGTPMGTNLGAGKPFPARILLGAGGASDASCIWGKGDADLRGARSGTHRRTSGPTLIGLARSLRAPGVPRQLRRAADSFSFNRWRPRIARLATERARVRDPFSDSGRSSRMPRPFAYSLNAISTS